MIFFLALIPATMLTIAGYAAIFLAHRSEGGLRNFGKYLGFWAFILAALLLLGSFLHAAHGGRMHGLMKHGYGAEWPAGPCSDMAPWREPPPAGGGPPGAPAMPAAAPTPGAAPPK